MGGVVGQYGLTTPAAHPRTSRRPQHGVVSTKRHGWVTVSASGGMWLHEDPQKIPKGLLA